MFSSLKKHREKKRLEKQYFSRSPNILVDHPSSLIGQDIASLRTQDTNRTEHDTEIALRDHTYCSEVRDSDHTRHVTEDDTNLSEVLVSCHTDHSPREDASMLDIMDTGNTGYEALREDPNMLELDTRNTSYDASRDDSNMMDVLDTGSTSYDASRDYSNMLGVLDIRNTNYDTGGYPLKENLKAWAVSSRQKCIHLDSLLGILKPLHPSLPTTYKTLLATPRNVKVFRSLRVLFWFKISFPSYYWKNIKWTLF